jgi:hypothetical protein
VLCSDHSAVILVLEWRKTSCSFNWGLNSSRADLWPSSLCGARLPQRQPGWCMPCFTPAAFAAGLLVLITTPPQALLHRLSSTRPSSTLLTLSAPTWGLPPFSDIGVLNMWHSMVPRFASSTRTSWSRKCTRFIYIDSGRHRPRPHDPPCFVYIDWAKMVHATTVQRQTTPRLPEVMHASST